MRLMLAAVVVLLGVGCKGPRGEAGPAGPSGTPGRFTEFSGAVTAARFSVSVAPLVSGAAVSVYYSLASTPNVFLEIGDMADSVDPWCAVDYGSGAVFFYNMHVGDKYKIIVSQAAAAPSAWPFGSRLLE